MKVVMKPIDMIAWSTEDGTLTPLKFRINEEENRKTKTSKKIIKVNKILLKKEEKLAGNRVLVYRCQSTVNKTEKVYELKYEFSTCKWFLYKI